MQPGNILDDEASLAELGYDIIGTDGESQTESTTSSLDYQRPDDVQSLTGTDTGTDVDTNDVDTDSSDEEEEVALNDDRPPLGPDELSENEAAGDEDASIELLADQSLENPTNFEQYGIPSIGSLAAAKQRVAQALGADADQAQSSGADESIEEQVRARASLPPKGKAPTPDKFHLDSAKDICRMAFDYVKQHRHILIYHALLVSGLAAFSTMFMAGKSYFSPPTPRVLSTVPVAAVSSAAVSPLSSVTPPLSTHLSSTITATTTVPNALQTDASSSSYFLRSLGKEKTQPQTGTSAPEQTICSAELFGQNEIIVKIPQSIKSSWLAKEAIMIAVSRGSLDIPTKMSSVEEGFLIQLPREEAHGILDVSIATTRKPKVNEAFQVNFGRYIFAEALDAGKQLVKGFAQRVADAVNETTTWVEETYIPALDVLSSQVCGKKPLVSDAVRRSVKDARTTALELPTRLLSRFADRIKPSLNADTLAQRASQAQLELARQAQDIRDELSLGLLTAQLSSKLWWLKVQGKEEEHQRYLSNAVAYYKQKQADALDARRERAARTKEEIRTRRKPESPDTRSSFWKGAVGF
ncbi:hypothetical protein DL766_009516 [Monosporascus sp. MC13-8B]|nr:hypothetical protein DL766_009516 [Monosporascus sp. MC13-8B]